MTIYTNGTKIQQLNIGQTVNGQNPVIPGLIAHYALEKITGTDVKDENGNFGATAINGPTVVPGRFGQAFNFVPASTQYVDAGVAMGNALGNGVSALSVSLWFINDIPTGNEGLFYIGDLASSRGEFHIRVSGNIALRMSNLGFDFGASFADTTSWHHVFAQYTGAAGQLFLDNVKIIDEPWSTNLNLTGLKTVLAVYFNTTNLLSGKMDQLRIYNRALTPTEINWLYNEKVGPWIYRNGKAA